MEQLKLFGYLENEILENELILFDRLEKIKTTIEEKNEDNFYISFSGGKDSTVLHHLIDMALPGNKIPRVFSNTGLEYNLIQKFVKDFAKSDKRFHIIKPTKNIPKTLARVGYPFKSKEYSCNINLYKNGNKGEFIKNYFNPNSTTKYKCPKILRYQLEDDFKLKISDRCCIEFKKKPLQDYYKKFEKIIITGMRKAEGGRRSSLKCFSINNGRTTRFHPLSIVDDFWIDWFIKTYKIKLSDLYYAPYNLKRTGCVGCPFAIEIENELRILQKHLAKEYKRAYLYFGKVYEEYKRIQYRIKTLNL